MGNRCVITWSKDEKIQASDALGVYLHYDGGIENVMAYLKYCELKGYRTPDKDDYGYARLCQVIGNAIGGTTGLGINKCCNLDCDNGQNGTYICKGWEIEKRAYRGTFIPSDFNMEERLMQINSRQPEKEKLPTGLLMSAALGKVPAKELQIGESVWIQRFTGEWFTAKIVGYGENEFVNGQNVEGKPYFNKYYHGKGNINNYVLDEYVYPVV